MKVHVTIKQAGKHKEYLSRVELVLQGVPASLRELITQVVHLNVSRYNAREDKTLIMAYLSDENIGNQAKTGKVGFGALEPAGRINADSAVETAVIAFQDGIYRVL